MVAAAVAPTLESSTQTPPREIPVLAGALPLIGHIPLLQKDPLALVTRVRDELGDMGILKVTGKEIIVVSEPHAVERVLVDNVKSYTKQTRGYDNLRKVFGNGLVTSEGSFWLRQRRIAQPAFHRERLADLAKVMQRDTDELLADLQKRPGQPFDFNNAMMKLTMRIIGEVLFSVDVSGDSDAAGAAINELVHQLMSRTIGLNAPMFVPTQRNRAFKKAQKDLDALVLGVIAQRRAGEDKPDLLSMLMHAVDEETGEKMNDQQLKDEVLTLFSAGHETTSMAVSWMLHALMDHPAVLQKLLAEIDEAPLDMRRLMSMPYLDAVWKETLRLYPPIWNVARYAEDDDVLAGYRVKKGQLLFISQWVLHRHPRYWPEPLQFDPRRFLVDDPSDRPKYAYFPFLGGPRKCIGDSLAILEAKIIVTTLLRALTFTRVPGYTVTPDPAVSLRIKEGLQVTAAPRVS